MLVCIQNFRKFIQVISSGFESKNCQFFLNLTNVSCFLHCVALLFSTPGASHSHRSSQRRDAHDRPPATPVISEAQNGADLENATLSS